jgi:hypothetical protein
MPETLDFQQRRIRILFWRTIIALLKEAHHIRFKGRRFGHDVQLLLVYGAAVTFFLEGEKVRIAPLARYLEMPHETVRRHMKTITKMELMEAEDHTFKPTGAIRLINISNIEKIMKECAREIIF